MAETLFNAVGARLESLIPRFGLADRRAQVFDAYRLICGESLALPVGDQRPEMCRINRDGTAVQFSLALSRSERPALQFFGEAGAPGSSGADRMARGHDAIRAVATLIGADRELAAVSDLLEQIAPRDASPRAKAG